MASNMINNLRNYFDEMVVYKDLKNSNFFSALSLPSFTRDWLLRKFEDESGHFDHDELAECNRCRCGREENLRLPPE